MTPLKIFAINLGSTSTKIAYYEDETCLLKQTIAHSLEDLQHADGIFAQYGFRRRDIEAFLAEHHIAVTDLDAIVSRGGPTAPVEGGTYRIDEDMLAEIRTGKYGIHPCSLGCQIVNLSWLYFSHELHKRHRITHVGIVQVEMGLAFEVGDALTEVN